jgi:biopolymer transport protein ExbD
MTQHHLSQDEIDALLKRLQQLTEERDVQLSADERRTVREVIAAWNLWRSFGVVGRALAWALMSIAALALAWGQLKTEISKWFGS